MLRSQSQLRVGADIIDVHEVEELSLIHLFVCVFVCRTSYQIMPQL